MTSTTTRINKPDTEPDLLRARADLGLKIAEIDRRLAALKTETVDAWRYSGTSLPANCSRRAFNAYLRAHDVVGKRLEGHVWSCPKHAWHEARRRERAVVQRDVKPDDAALADQALAGAGLRTTVRRAG